MSSAVSAQAMPAASSASPQASQSAHSPNDVPAKEPSPDIINNLLASLSSLSLPSDSDQYSPLIPGRTTSKTSRRLSRPSSQKFPPPTSVFSREAPSEFQDINTAQEHAPIGEISVNVAAGPTIKTSRPPSGYSPLTSPRPSRKGKPSYNLRGAFAPPPSRSPSATPSREPTLPRLPEDSLSLSKTVKPKKSTDEARKAPSLTLKKRDSLQVTRSREAKGKQRAGPPSPLYSPLPPQQPLQPRSPYSRSRSPIPPRPFYSEYVSPRRSPAPSVKARDDLYTHRASASLQHEDSSDNFVIIHRKSGESAQPRPDRRRFIPSRSSSVGRTSASRRGSRRSSLRSQHQSPETVHEERSEDEQASPRIDDKKDSQDLGLGEENNVIKRIKQLRAAKELREKSSLTNSSPNEADEDLAASGLTVASTRKPTSPDTSIASKQLEEAAAIKKHEVTVKPESGSTSAEPPSAATFSSESPVLMSGEYANFSRPRLTLVDGGSSTLTQPPIQVNGSSVQQSPLLSRASSRAKRWSNPDLSSRKNSVQHHARNSSTNSEKVNSTYPALVEEQRASLDSVNESVEEFLTSPRLSQRISLPSESRVISFSEVGDPQGHAVFCCIGMGMTRYVMAFYEELATSLKLRLITPERPGVGDSEAYEEPRVPLHWPDDVRAICNHLSIQSFSLLAHSAGAIYALATALKMPSRVRGRIHLLAPWIPPSQLATPPTASLLQGSPVRAGGLPRSQRLLRYVPTPILKLGSASYLAGGNKPTGTKSPNLRKGPRAGADSGATSVTSPRPSTSSKSFSNAPSFMTMPLPSSRTSVDRKPGLYPRRPVTPRLEDMVAVPSDHSMTAAVLSAGGAPSSAPTQPSSLRQATTPDAAEWQKRYDSRLTALAWELATRKGNPTVDLVVCLERNRAIGFMYRDVAREIVVHHGSNDRRVPLENVKWLGSQVLQKCELRVLEGEGHGLMASAGVMASVLGEVGQEAGMGEDYGNLGDASSYKSPLLDGGETF